MIRKSLMVVRLSFVAFLSVQGLFSNADAQTYSPSGREIVPYHSERESLVSEQQRLRRENDRLGQTKARLINMIKDFNSRDEQNRSRLSFSQALKNDSVLRDTEESYNYRLSLQRDREQLNEERSRLERSVDSFLRENQRFGEDYARFNQRLLEWNQQSSLRTAPDTMREMQERARRNNNSTGW